MGHVICVCFLQVPYRVEGDSATTCRLPQPFCHTSRPSSALILTNSLPIPSILFPKEQTEWCPFLLQACCDLARSQEAMTKWDFGMHCTSPQHLIDSCFHFAEFWLLTSWKRSVGMVTGFTDGFTTRQSKGICFGPLVDSGHTIFSDWEGVPQNGAKRGS